jgi:hypothetical protein
MENLIVSNDNEKRCIFRQIIDLQKQGIISNVDSLKALRYASSNIKNKYNNSVIERASYHNDDINSFDSRDLNKIACSIIARS